VAVLFNHHPFIFYAAAQRKNGWKDQKKKGILCTPKRFLLKCPPAAPRRITPGCIPGGSIGN
jgi:hypothetical protein